MELLTSVLSEIGILDVIDILIVAFVVYKLFGLIMETRAEQLIKGLLILVAATFLADKLHLYTLYFSLKGTTTLGVFALVVVFQPELRRALEYMGRSKFLKPKFTKIDKERAKNITKSVSKAIDYFSANKTGALIIIERETSLSDIAETGTYLNAEISTELLGNIFYEGAPLHDGAVIIRQDKILAAGCVLPLTQNKGLSKDLGTRHRAGLGITENSDAITFIVSEESGVISIATDGALTRFLDIKSVDKALLNIYFGQVTEGREKGMKAAINKFKSRNGGKDK